MFLYGFSKQSLCYFSFQILLHHTFPAFCLINLFLHYSPPFITTVLYYLPSFKNFLSSPQKWLFFSLLDFACISKLNTWSWKFNSKTQILVKTYDIFILNLGYLISIMFSSSIHLPITFFFYRIHFHCIWVL